MLFCFVHPDSASKTTPRMPESGTQEAAQWLKHGAEAFEVMRSLIQRATRSLRLETYICADSDLTLQFRTLLIEARSRGVEVTVLIDAFGSLELRSDFWTPLVQAGGRMRWFNPLSLKRLSYRNHRKLLVCDDHTAVIGGFNLSPDYDGDGVEKGWRDLGMLLTGTIVQQLSESFDLLYERAAFRHRLWERFRRRGQETIASGRRWKLLLNIPSFRQQMIKRMLVEDLQDAKSVRITSAYFLPTWRIRHRLLRLARSGGKVQLILAGKSDVRLAQLASQRLYEMFLKAGVEIYEYQPQILHAKLVIIDDLVYAGSCNLDLHSLNVNYELMVRLNDPTVTEGAHALFRQDLGHCRKIDLYQWKSERSLWTKIREQAAYFLLARLDPVFARWQREVLR